MTTSAIRVLVVDDSAFMRKVLVKMLEPYPDIHVVATAMDGIFALDKIARARPDVVTLDLEMPRMDGLTALARLVGEHELPVILVSAHTSEGAKATFEGLAAGAVDFVTKPERIFSSPLGALADALVEKIRMAAKVKVNRASRVDVPHPVVGRDLGRGSSPALDVVAIAVSTGGPNALSKILGGIDDGFGRALLIVQHMPEGFTGQFAERLNRLAAIEVREAEDGDCITAGLALLAPGGRHMEVTRSQGRLHVRLSRTPPVGGHRPSADILFRSVAEVVGGRAVGLILTGMGEDGARGLGAIRAAGGLTVAQDEASSVVYGMPRAAIQRGAVRTVLPLPEMASFLNSLETEKRGSPWNA
ncbi:MAG TPA: chemotaxis response regulator protein-glutamate methylesterase [Vicinamibacteria bacterium]|nr:chemotaxis response regulator protein-glutamate methylesterase [Vicinamibacteria bacterium]